MNERPSSVASLGAIRVTLCIVVAVAPLFAVGVSCTSSSDDAVAEDGDAATEASPTVTPQPEAATTTHQDAAAPTQDAGHPTGSGNDGGTSPADAGSDAKDANKKDAAATSDACAAYCACYEKKCSVFVPLPGNQECPDFCAGFVNNKTQYDCRFNMCFYNSNGPAQNNNNHCQHTVGIDECL